MGIIVLPIQKDMFLKPWYNIMTHFKYHKALYLNLKRKRLLNIT